MEDARMVINFKNENEALLNDLELLSIKEIEESLDDVKNKLDPASVYKEFYQRYNQKILDMLNLIESTQISFTQTMLKENFDKLLEEGKRMNLKGSYSQKVLEVEKSFISYVLVLDAC